MLNFIVSASVEIKKFNLPNDLLFAAHEFTGFVMISPF